jgi:hypothetical protein
MQLQAKSSEIAEELTATAPLQFGRQVHEVNKNTQRGPHPATRTMAIAKLAGTAPGQICVPGANLHAISL